ncbi:MAG: hypothetical protein JOZ31_12630 [Verrucomicrobia bacterium]|nr:hypothetical protein [Verrucomicrobiota bacterium]
MRTNSIPEFGLLVDMGRFNEKAAISFIAAFIVLLSVCAGEENIRVFRAVDAVDLERKVPRGYLSRFFA